MRQTDATLLMPVFPLPLFILPEGRQRLRIFEAKYISMIGRIQQDNCFVVARYDKNLSFNIPSWGTLVHIADFHVGEDQILLIDVEAIRLLELTNMTYQNDGLLLAQTRPQPHWDLTSVIDKPPEFLSHALQTLLEKHSHFGDLYPSLSLSRVDWVCARLIEVLPIPLIEKEKFIQSNSLPSLISLLSDIFDTPHKKK